MCKTCKNDYNKKHYNLNKEYFYNKKLRHKKKIKSYINKLKCNPCVDCGKQYHPCAMQFDHLPGFNKRFNISNAKDNTTSIRSLKTEIKKCELVCAICHAYRTHNRRTGEQIVL